jgi:hypothetical protein
MGEGEHQVNGNDPIPVRTLAQSLNALCSVIYDLIWEYEGAVTDKDLDEIPHLVFGYAVDLGYLPPPDQAADLDDPWLLELNAWCVPPDYYENFMSIISDRLAALRWEAHNAFKSETPSVNSGTTVRRSPRELIDEWRYGTGTTVDELASQAKCSVATLNRIRLGQHTLRASNLRPIGLVIGCDWQKLRWRK